MIVERQEEFLPDPCGMVGRIPVRNLWLLMLYASDLFRAQGIRNVQLEESPDNLPDLVAEILSHAVEARQRRRLNQSFRPREAVLSRVRGRIDVLSTARRRLLERGQIACRFQELTIDSPRNRFVRAALEAISRIVRGKLLANRCRALANGMKTAGVSSLKPTRSEVSTDQIGRNDAEDRIMLAAAQLAFDLALPTEFAGVNALVRPIRDEIWVRQLFEKAVGGFFHASLASDGWRVRRSLPLDWQIECASSGMNSVLPRMKTDIVLDHTSAGRRIVVDTKFAAILTAGWHRERTIRSAYLYQMYAYLRSQVGQGDVLADSAEGVLLHPSVDQLVDETVRIQGHDIRFVTVDLAASPQEIRSQLLRIVVGDSETHCSV